MPLIKEVFGGLFIIITLFGFYVILEFQQITKKKIEDKEK